MAPERNRPGRPDGAGGTAGQRARRRVLERPEVELTEEELRALADDGIDPEDLRRIARERSDALEASDHDRDTVRDELEGLAFEAEEDY